jgi:hypothetical protein
LDCHNEKLDWKDQKIFDKVLATSASGKASPKPGCSSTKIFFTSHVNKLPSYGTEFYFKNWDYRSIRLTDCNSIYVCSANHRSWGRCFLGSATPCASPPPWPSIFSYYSFLVHHLVNWDDRHLLAHAHGQRLLTCLLWVKIYILPYLIVLWSNNWARSRFPSRWVHFDWKKLSFPFSFDIKLS